MKRLLLLAVLCTLAAAMVPRERRAIDETETTTAGKRICEPLTPCGWIFYNKFPELVESRKDNDYCQCDTNMDCKVDEDDVSGLNIIKRCKPRS